MMIPVWINPGDRNSVRLADWVSFSIYGKHGKFQPTTSLAVLDSLSCQLVAGVLFYDYDPDAQILQISAASKSPRWLTRPVLWEIFDFPFNQLACQSVVMRVDPDHTRLHRILTAYGFSSCVLPRLRGRNKNEALYILHDDVWRANRFHRHPSYIPHPRHPRLHSEKE